MTVKRIVATIAAGDIDRAQAFYGDVLGLGIAMDHGWIRTYAAPGTMVPQISIAREGGSGTPVPDISIEVDDLDAVHARMLEAGFIVEYGPLREPWGVRRFFVRDPFQRLINVLSHEDDSRIDAEAN